MEKRLEEFLSSFFALEIVSGKRVRIPYWRNKITSRGRVQGPFGGKGRPKEIRRITLKKAEETGIKLERMTTEEIREFMRRKRIGIDCSGFVFQILDFLFPGFWRGLKMAPGWSRNPIRRFNAAALTSKENTRPVKRLREIKTGDLIPLSFTGKRVDHVLVVVDKNKKEIVYAHSSSRTPNDGPHLGRIKIIDWGEDLKRQYWEEKTKEGKNLGEFLVGGRARRVKNG